MARRMFSTEIVNSDFFLDMPSSTQSLYFHLGMHCDDDGFVYPKKVMRMVAANEDDLKILLGKKFLIDFGTGVIVIKHWRVNNYLRSDRYRPTTHTEELALLFTDKGNVYHMATAGIPSGSISKEVSKKEINKELIKSSRDTEDPMRRIGENLRVRGVLPPNSSLPPAGVQR